MTIAPPLIVRILDCHPALALEQRELPVERDYFRVGRADSNDLVVPAAPSLVIAKKAMWVDRRPDGGLVVTHGGSVHRVFVHAADGLVHEIGYPDRTRSIELGDRIDLYSGQGTLAVSLTFVEGASS